LEREAALLLRHFEKNIQEALSSLQQSQMPFLGMEESIAEYLVEAAYGIDQMDQERDLTLPDLRAAADQYLLTSIEIYDPKGNPLKGWPLQSATSRKRFFLRELIEKKRSVVIDQGEDRWFTIAISRKMRPGIIALHIDREQGKKILRQFFIQRAISDIGLKEDILYVAVQDPSFVILAHTDPSLIGKKQEDSFLMSSFQKAQLLSRLLQRKQREETFEVAKSFSLGGNPAGLIRIGYSPKEIYPILGQIKKNVALSILFFLILGVSAITLIWVNQNRHLRRMNEMEDRIQLAERLSSLGHLAAGVAHEIRNPLNAIGMGLQRLKREFSPHEESKLDEYRSFTDLILNEIRRVNGIIEQFLTLSRPFHLDLRRAPVQELLKDLITLFQEEASSKNIALQAEIDPGLPLIAIDPERLKEAFMNIMKNGMEAMEIGGTLSVSTRSFKDRVEVVISDSGSGIPPDQMEKIFNFYYTTKEKGSGLGLPIAHRIIEAHGGQIRAESRIGVGTKVTVILPLG
jgi:signal transduction histidine kinase